MKSYEELKKEAKEAYNALFKLDEIGFATPTEEEDARIIALAHEKEAELRAYEVKAASLIERARDELKELRKICRMHSGAADCHRCSATKECKTNKLLAEMEEM